MPWWFALDVRKRALGRDEAPARRRVNAEALGVALVDPLPGLVGLLFGEPAAGQVRLKPREVALPARRGLRGKGAVVEDVDEDQQAAALLHGQLEAVELAVEDPGEAMRCVDFGHLPGHAARLEGLSGCGDPVGGGGKPALELRRVR